MAKVHLVYDDGRQDTVPLRAKGLVAAERHFGEKFPRIEGTLYAVWAQLDSGLSFDDWSATVEVDIEDTGAAPPPSAPADAE